MTSGLTTPAAVRARFTKLEAVREKDAQERDKAKKRVGELQTQLDRSQAVSDALEQLSQELFDQVLKTVEEKLTQALREVFVGEPIALKTEKSFKAGSPHVEFLVTRNGKEEDIIRGQGGSVLNVLSVGLRMFALATQDSKQHRPFLVLDEQDCWLRPDLVPHLVRIVALAAKELGLQVLLISHHDPQLFAEHADKAYKLVPSGNGVTAKAHDLKPSTKELVASGALADPTPGDKGHGLVASVPLEKLLKREPRTRALAVSELEDYGFRLARLVGRPSVVLVTAEEPLEVDLPKTRKGERSSVVEIEGGVAVDGAELRAPVRVRGSGVELTVQGTQDRSFSYDLRVSKGRDPASRAAQAIARAQVLEVELRELGNYPLPEDAQWREWFEGILRSREELEGSGERVRRALCRLDERGRATMRRILALEAAREGRRGRGLVASLGRALSLHPHLLHERIVAFETEELRSVLRAAPWCWPVEEPFLGRARACGIERPSLAPGDVPLLSADEHDGAGLWLFRPGPCPGEKGTALDEPSSWRAALGALGGALPFLARSTRPLEDLVPPQAILVDSLGEHYPNVLAGESFGLAFLLAQASWVLETPLPEDLCAAATIQGDGRVGPVSGLWPKLRLVVERAVGLRRVLVAEEQAAEARGLGVAIEVVPVRTAADAVRIAFPEVERAWAARRTGERDAARERLFGLALGERREAVSWRPVARAAAFALEHWTELEADERTQLELARAIALRHEGETVPVVTPPERLFARLPQPDRVECVAHLVQHAADTGTPDPEAMERLAERFLARGPEAFPVHLKLLGALGPDLQGSRCRFRRRAL